MERSGPPTKSMHAFFMHDRRYPLSVKRDARIVLTTGLSNYGDVAFRSENEGKVEEETNEEAKEKEATQLAHTSPAHRQIQETLCL